MSEDPAAATKAAIRYRRGTPCGRGKGRRPACHEQRLPDETLDILIDRLEYGIQTGLLPLNFDFFRAVLAALFPENFGRELPLPDQPTDTQPFTDERLHVWANRAKDRKCLWHPRDAQTTAIEAVRPIRGSFARKKAKA